MKKNKNSLLLGIVGVVVLIILIVIITSNKTVTCKISNELSTGFNNKEEVVIKLTKNKIKRIKLNKTITISDFYQKEGDYYTTLEKIFNTGYSSVGGKIKASKEAVSVSIDTKKSGVVVNGISIMKNNEHEDTSIRFDTATNLDVDNAYKIGDKYSAKDLKKKIEAIGYKCK